MCMGEPNGPHPLGFGEGKRAAPVTAAEQSRPGPLTLALRARFAPGEGGSAVSPPGGERRRRVGDAHAACVSTLSKRSSAQLTSSRVITRGGAMRMVWTWVSLASTPRSRSRSQ